MPHAQSPLGLLRTRRAWPLCVTQMCGAFNDNLLKNALIILAAFKVAHVGAGFVAMAGAVFILPYLLLSGLGGQLADRFSKRRYIIWIKLSDVAIMCVAAAGFFWGNIALLFMVLGAGGIQAALFGPVKYGILPEQLSHEELVAGNGLVEGTTFLSILAGTVAGSLILLPHGDVLVSAVGVGVAILGVWSAGFIPPTQAAEPALKISWNILAGSWALVRAARRNSRVWYCALGLSWFWALAAAVIAEFPSLVRDNLGCDGPTVSFLLGVFAVGIGTGSMLAARMLRGDISVRYVPLAALGMGFFCWDFGHTSLMQRHYGGIGAMLGARHGWHVVIDLLGLAIAGGLFSVPLNAMMQEAAPKRSRARIIGANNVVNAVFIIAAAAAVAAIEALGFNAPKALILLAMADFVVSAVIIWILPNAFLRPFFQFYFRVLHRTKITGMEHYRAAGQKVVLVSNHLSYIDALMIATFLPDSPSVAIHTYQLRTRWKRLATSTVRLFTVDVSHPFAIKSMIEAVRDQGEKLLIFPEGRLSQTGGLMRIFEGAAIIADKAGAKLVPMAIDGTQFTPFGQMQGKLRLHWFPQLSLQFFPAIDMTPPNAEQMSVKERRQVVAEHLQEIMITTSFISKNINRSLLTAFVDARKLHGGKSLILEDINRDPISFDRVLLGAVALGRKLIVGTQPGERLGIMLPNANANFISFLALSAFGRVPAMLNYSAGPEVMLAACATAQLTHVISSRAFIEKGKLESVVARLQEKVSFIWLEDVRASIGARDKLRAKWDSVFARTLPGAKTKADSPLCVLFTSGSEGMPKGVVLSHKNILANCAQLASVIDFSPRDRVFNALPMFHSFGLVGATLLPVLAGVRTLLYPSPLHYRIVPGLIYDSDSTICFGTDTFLNGWARYADPYDFFAMRYIFAGAERVRDETKLLYAEKFGVRIMEGYGATETSPVIAMNNAMKSRRGTVGPLLPGIESRLEKVPGVAEGGRLFVRGPNIMLGYLRHTAPGVLEAPPDGWYDTGDVVQISDDGFVSVTGRVKRFAKIGGEMISMSAAENLVASLWPDDQHAVIAVPDARKGEALLLVTCRKDADLGDILAFARARGFSEIMVPRAVMEVEELPVLGSGKIDYPAVQMMAASLTSEAAA